MSDNDVKIKDHSEKVQRILSIVKVLILLFIVVGIPLLVYLRYPQVLDLFTDPEALNALLEKHGKTGSIIFLGIQIFQVVVSVIPGQIVQAAAGFVFGGVKAYILAIIGVAIGTFTAFNLSKYLGKDIIFMIFKEKTVNRFLGMMSSKRAFIVVVLIYLIPGLPKDVFTYAAGLSNYKVIPFVLTSIVARSPAMIGSLAFGAMLRSQNYVGMVILCVFVGALLVVALIKRKALFAFLDKFNTNKEEAVLSSDNDDSTES